MVFFFVQAEDGIRDYKVTGVQTCALPILCTSVCHQGIDVMNFANKGLPMEDPQCVRCSACVEKCPTGVLAFGRYAGDGLPVLDRMGASPVRMAEGKRVPAHPSP